jgi:hypothetical protein
MSDICVSRIKSAPYVLTNPLSFFNDPKWFKKTAKIINNVFMIDGKEESFYNTNTPFVFDADVCVDVMFYGIIEVPRSNHTGPLFVLGYLDDSGRFQVEDKLVKMYEWNPYPITQPKTNVNKRVCYAHLKMI